MPPGSSVFARCRKFPGKALTLCQKRGFPDAGTCDLHGGDPLVDRVNAALDDIAGQPAIHGEVLQGQRYAAGQEFKFHTGHFEPDGPDWLAHSAVGGQRTWTLMACLNEPAGGGSFGGAGASGGWGDGMSGDGGGD